ncbi:MAG TPA: hypothetical protein VLF94_04310 [Chlamydiales bacterium]|nr:hypothetical protein [Chlamydiales bacterium]
MSISSIGTLDDFEPLAIQEMGGYVPSKPTLPAPANGSVSTIGPSEPFSMANLINSYLETERISNKEANLFHTEIQQNLDEIKRLEDEKRTELKKQAEAVKSQTTWSTLAHMAQYISGVGAIMLGVSALPISVAAAVVAFLFGGLTILDRLAHDTPLMDKIVSGFAKTDETQKRLAAKIDMFLAALELGLGIAGGFWAWHAGVFAAAQAAATTEAVLTKASTIITIGAKIATKGAEVGMKFYEKQIADITARLKEVNGEIVTNQQEMYQSGSQVSRMLESAKGEADAIKSAIQDFQVTFD